MTQLISLNKYKIMLSDKEIFSRWLKKAIKLEGIIKGKDLSDKTGIAPSTISGYLNDKTYPDLQNRLKICQAIGVDYNKIIMAGREDDFEAGKKFKNQSTADEVIKLLVELESIDQFALGEIGRMVREKIEILKTKNRIDEPLLKPENVPKKHVG